MTKEEIQKKYNELHNESNICSKCGRERIFINGKHGYKEFYGFCSKDCFFENSAIDKNFIKNYLMSDEKTLISQRMIGIPISQEDIYRIYYDITDRPICDCGKEIPFSSFKNGYHKNCSKECSYKSESRNKKVSSSLLNKSQEEKEAAVRKNKQTKKDRYGNENYNNKDKIKSTTISKYSKENVGQCEDVKLKIKKTKEEKYGDPGYNNQQKINITKEERYGNYKYNNSKKASETRKHKSKLGFQCGRSHINNIDNLNKEFIESNFVSSNGELKRDEFMNYFGCKDNFMNSKLRELKVNFKRRKSYVESEIRDLIPGSILNSRTIISPSELDVYSHSLKLGIEYNGLMFHSQGYAANSRINDIEKDYHLYKTELCESLDIQLYHIFENEWKDLIKRDIWISKINGKQNKHNKIYARKCTIKEISSKESNDFLELYHLQGKCNSSIRLGLFYNDSLISVMTFGKSRYKKDIEYELIRFASKINMSIIGGASKLLKYFERNYNPKSLISYANRRWSKGDVYEKLGFEYNGCTPPNYFYFLPSEYILYSREKFQKHKLNDLLEHFDPDLTETENMFSNGYRKIYDCGNKVYIKRY